MQRDEVAESLRALSQMADQKASILMGASANMPLALAPGMGLNAYFAFTAVPLLAECAWLWWLVSTAAGGLAFEMPAQPGLALVLVLGHPTYYPRFGFRPASELGLAPPSAEIPDEAFMAVPLKTYDESIRGRVVFPPAFG